MHEWFEFGVLGFLWFFGVWMFILVTYFVIGVVKFLNRWVFDDCRKQAHPTAWLPSSTQNAVTQERSDIKPSEIRVAELPPEVIAPHLKKPPRTRGFGGPGCGHGDEQPK